MWPIRRTKPIGARPGFAIPIFIRNMQYHLTTVDAYSDGAIDVWGLVDRPLFEGKLRSGWVWLQPPEGCRISVFNLGLCQCHGGIWLCNTGDIRGAVQKAIQINNPEMTNLLDMEGSETELRGKVRWAKLSGTDDHPVRRSENGSEVPGREVPVFAKRDGNYILTRTFVFADGSARVGASGEVTTQEAIYKAFDSGELTTSVSDGTRISVEGLGSFISDKGLWFVKSSERVKEIRDLVAQLGGKTDAIRLCIEAKKDYDSSPSEANRQRLRDTYEAVPEHLRKFCGDMDSKDWPIKRVLYGNQNSETP